MTHNDWYFHFDLYEIYSKHMYTWNILVVTEWTNISIRAMFATGTIMMKDFDRNEGYMRRRVYFQFSGKHGNLMKYCFSVWHFAKVTTIIEWPYYVNCVFRNRDDISYVVIIGMSMWKILGEEWLYVCFIVILIKIWIDRAPSQYKDRLIYVWRFPC